MLRFRTFAEADAPALLEALAAADLVVGFNLRRFDYRVLRAYSDRDLQTFSAYCRRDVALLRDLLTHAVDKGYRCFRTRSGERVRIPTPWSPQALVEEARASS